MAHMALVKTINTHALWNVYTINKIKLKNKLVITKVRTSNFKVNNILMWHHYLAAAPY